MYFWMAADADGYLCSVALALLLCSVLLHSSQTVQPSPEARALTYLS